MQIKWWIYYWLISFLAYLTVSKSRILSPDLDGVYWAVVLTLSIAIAIFNKNKKEGKRIADKEAEFSKLKDKVITELAEDIS